MRRRSDEDDEWGGPDRELMKSMSAVSPVYALQQRMGHDPILVALLQKWLSANPPAGLERPFDGRDASSDQPPLIVDVLIRVEKLLLEMSVLNRPAPGRVIKAEYQLAESKQRQVESLLMQALRLALEVHFLMHGVGTEPKRKKKERS